MRSAPPILWIAVGWAAGAASQTALGFDRDVLPLLVAALLTGLWRGPTSPSTSFLLSMVAGLAWADGDETRRAGCLSRIQDRTPAVVQGYFLRGNASGPSELRVVAGIADCRPVVSVYSRSPEPPPEGRFVTVRGRWLRSASSRVYLSAGSIRPGPGHVPAVQVLRARLRGGARAALRRHLGSQEGVAAALVLADRDGVPGVLREQFVRSGLAHLLSISGFHVGVVGALLSGCLHAVGQPPTRRATGAVVGVWGYVALIGAPTSALRAAWMMTAFALARVRRLPVRTLGSLGFSMLLVTTMTPGAAGEAGFQLTVAGTAGILVFGRWVARTWPRRRGIAWLGPPVAASVGASLFTAPVLAYHFGQVPLLSLPGSLVTTPLVAAAVPGLLGVIVLEGLGVPGAGALGAGSEGLLLSVSWVARGLASFDWAVAPVTPVQASLVGGGALLPLVLWRAPWRIAVPVRIAVSGATAAACLAVGTATLSLAGRGRVEIVAIDVGQGDAIAVRTPLGRWFLVDAGPRLGTGDAGEARIIPFLRSKGARRLEAVVLSHPDEDHAGGLESVLDGLPVGAVLGPGRTAGQRGHRGGLAVALSRSVPWRRVSAGDEWTADGVSFRVLSPTEHSDVGSGPNDWSVVLLVQFGDFDALLMGDAGRDIEESLLPLEPIDVLKVGHHGSRTSTSEPFVASIAPRIALVSVGARNRYGHPAGVVLRRLRRAGSRVLRTDVHGTVRVLGRRDGSVRVHTTR